MTFRLGLTGSIGMGKSTTAEIFAQKGCLVWDADAAVHRLYAKGGAGVAPLAKAFPNAIIDGSVSREKLKEIIQNDPDALKTIEKIVHPLVVMDRKARLESARADIMVFDVPLLFETGGQVKMDAVVVVSAPAALQKQRVMARGTMTVAQFEHILSRQMPDAEKRARADYVVITDTVEHATKQVQDILAKIRRKLIDA